MVKKRSGSGSLPKVLIITLGGTISMTADAGGGIRPTLSGSHLISDVDGIDAIADVHVISPYLLPSNHLKFSHIDHVASLIRENINSGVTGVVVVQGTDTIEETAFALDIMLDENVPIVMTGAMIGPGQLGADGARNLLHAIKVTASPDAVGKGVLVVFGEDIHAARHVQKRHTSRLDAFASQPGPVGSMREGKAVFSWKPPKFSKFDGGPTEDFHPKVALISAVFDEDAGMLEAVLGADFDGVVINGLGGGHVSPEMSKVLARGALHMPIVLATRTRGGTVMSSTYGYPGGEIELRGHGVIRAGWLDGFKARVLLMHMLRLDMGDADIRRAFSYYDGG